MSTLFAISHDHIYQSLLKNNIKNFPTEEPNGQDRLYKCMYCDRRFAESNYLRCHEAMHVPAPKSQECPDCGVAFSSGSAFVRHWLKEECKDEGFVCCDHIFTRRIDFLKHQQDCHVGKKIECHVCSVCGKNFSLPSTLKAHEKSHKQKSFTCKFCRKVLLGRAEMFKHSRTHIGEKFVCQICGKRYRKKANYVLHLHGHGDSPEDVVKPRNCSGEVHQVRERVHPGQKRFQCSYCDRSFSRAWSLTTHIYTHTGKKPFQCKHCDRRFARTWNLSAHLSTHTGEKRYPCGECGKRFAHYSTLQSHVFTHTGEKRYRCEDCGKRFVQWSTLHRHVRTHSKDDKGRSKKKKRLSNNPEISGNKRQGGTFVQGRILEKHQPSVSVGGFQNVPSLSSQGILKDLCGQAVLVSKVAEKRRKLESPREWKADQDSIAPAQDMLHSKMIQFSVKSENSTCKVACEETHVHDYDISSTFRIKTEVIENESELLENEGNCIQE